LSIQVGSDSALAGKAFSKVLGLPKIPVHLSLILADQSSGVHVHLDTGALEASFGSREAEVQIAVALSRAEY